MAQTQIEDTVNSNTAQQSYEVQIWKMRWFVLVIASIGFLGSISVSIILKSPVPMAGVLILQPIIRYLFPKSDATTNNALKP